MSYISKRDLIPLALIFGMGAAVIGIVGAGAAKIGLNPLMTDYNGAVSAAENVGLKNVKATGYGWFGCGVGEHADLWRTRFTATNQNGKEVKGVVCSSILKGATVRFE